jgi:hypothetical protein
MFVDLTDEPFSSYLSEVASCTSCNPDRRRSPRPTPTHRASCPVPRAPHTTGLLRACRRMKEDGWWYYDPKKNKHIIKIKLAFEVVRAIGKSILGMSND